MIGLTFLLATVADASAKTITLGDGRTVTATHKAEGGTAIADGDSVLVAVDLTAQDSWILVDVVIAA